MIDWVYWARILLAAASIFDGCVIVTAGIGLERSAFATQRYVLADDDVHFWGRMLFRALLVAVVLMIAGFELAAL